MGRLAVRQRLAAVGWDLSSLHLAASNCFRQSSWVFPSPCDLGLLCTLLPALQAPDGMPGKSAVLMELRKLRLYSMQVWPSS